LVNLYKPIIRFLILFMLTIEWKIEVKDLV